MRIVYLDYVGNTICFVCYYHVEVSHCYNNSLAEFNTIICHPMAYTVIIVHRNYR